MGVEHEAAAIIDVSSCGEDAYRTIIEDLCKLDCWTNEPDPEGHTEFGLGDDYWIPDYQNAVLCEGRVFHSDPSANMDAMVSKFEQAGHADKIDYADVDVITH